MKHFLKQTVRTYNDGRVEVILPPKRVFDHDSAGRVIHSKGHNQEAWYSYDPNHGKIVFERIVNYNDNEIYSTSETAYKYDDQARLVMEKITKDGEINTYTMQYNEYGVTARYYNGTIVESIEYKDDGSRKKFCTYEDGMLSSLHEYFEDGDVYSANFNIDGTYKEECWYNDDTGDFHRRVEKFVNEDTTIIWDHEYITDNGHNYASKVTETHNGELVSCAYYKGYYMIELQTPDYTETYEYTNGP